MSKKRTRFVVEINGKAREILSIIEKSNGQLTLMSGTSKYWENEDGTLEEYFEQHYSIHRTKNGLDTTITQKTTLKGGVRHSIVTYIHDTSTHLLWPVFARRPPLFQPDPNKLTTRQKDDVVELGSFNDKLATFFYSVFVTLPNSDLSAVYAAGVQSQIATFTNFRIVVLPMYLNVPTFSSGDVVGYSTSPQITNDVRRPDHFQIKATSPAQKELMPMHFNLVENLKRRLCFRIYTLFDIGSPELNQWYALAHEFTVRPILTRLRSTLGEENA